MRKWSWKLRNYTKEQLRQTVFAKRNAVTSMEREQAALLALSLLLKHPIFVASQNVACYFAQDNEFDCTPIMQAIWNAKKNCFLPVLSEKGLKFAAYQPNDALTLNRYDILEPENKVFIPAEKLDLVFLPMVAFDLQGMRLGMGGGYYDRTFAFALTQTLNKPFLMGLAYECQYIDEVPEEPNDVPLDAVLTEAKMYTFPRLAS